MFLAEENVIGLLYTSPLLSENASEGLIHISYVLILYSQSAKKTLSLNRSLVNN